jgi:hypothetical protein
MFVQQIILMALRENDSNLNIFYDYNKLIDSKNRPGFPGCNRQPEKKLKTFNNSNT